MAPGSRSAVMAGRTSGSLLEKRLQSRAKIGRRAADSVHVRSQPDAVLESQAVELVELLFGERQRRGTRRGQGAQHLADLVLEVGVFIHPRHEPSPAASE